MKRIIIIGAGAAGVYLSILLKQRLKEKGEVIVLEQNALPLKKLLATGNGRCNLSNRDMDISYYQCDDPHLVKDIIMNFDMVGAMEDLGLCCLYQGNLLYPKSEQALSVKQILMERANELGVLFFYEQEVLQIIPKERYHIQTNQQCFKADDVVLAMGSEAGKLSGIKQTRYHILKDLHLKVIKPIPSLVQMKTQPVMKQWKGVRVKGTFTLLENNSVVHQEKGELLFTDYGVSGIAIMQLSSYFQEGHHYDLSIDFFDHMSEKKCHEYIELRHRKYYNHFYSGLLNSKIAQTFEKRKESTVQEQVRLLKDFRLHIVGLHSFENAQVMRGGLSLKELDQDLQIIKYPHLYAMGEILNVAGMCGGYNLHFAFASARRVAEAIERKYHD